MKLSNVVLLSLLVAFINACSRIQDSIVGSWKDPDKQNSCVVFKKDGTFTSGTLSGSYTFTEEDKMIMKFDSSLFGVQEMDTKVSIEGDTLVILEQKTQSAIKGKRGQCQ